MNNEICPDRNLTPPESKVYDFCCVCGEPIYSGEYFYNITGDKVCEECILQYIKPFREIAE